MTEPYLSSSAGPTAETLMRRQEFLRLMLESHARWLHATSDQRLKSIHRNLLSSLEEVMEQYNLLLDELQRRH